MIDNSASRGRVLLKDLDINLAFHDPSNFLSDEDFALPSPFDIHNIESLYWNTDNVNKSLSPKQVQNFFLHLNIQGLRPKFDNFITMLDTLANDDTTYLPSIIALSETCLNDYNAKSYSIPGYHPFISNHRKDNSSRGGVGLFVKDTIHYDDCPELSVFIPFVFESIFIQLKPNDLIVGVIYRTPDSDLNHFLLQYEETLERLKNSNCHFILLGDLNVNLLNFNKDHQVTEYLNLTFEKNGLPVITKPTRIGPTSATCIDHIITSKYYDGSLSGILIEDVSDHFPVFYCFPNRIQKLNNHSPPHPTPHNFSKPNLDKLKNMLEEQDWSQVFSDSNPSTAADCLSVIISDLVNKTCPPRNNASKPKRSKLSQPWFTAGLKISSKKKNKLFKKALRSSESLSFYRCYRNIYNRLVRLAKQTYYSNSLLKAEQDLKKTWSIFNEIIGKPKHKTFSPTELHLSQPNSFTTTIKDPFLIAEYFNNFFSTVGSRNTTSSTNSDVDPLSYMNSFAVKDSCFLYPTNCKEISEIVLSLKSKTSSGPDNISNSLLKEIIPYILEPLTHIFNLSIQHGVVPHSYKLAKVIPVFKTGDKNDPNNYRPISLLPTISKILEKIIYKRVFKFILNQNIICPSQYGFVKGRSTEQAMTDIILKITNAIENKKFAIGLFLDLSKAFDSIPHDILLWKLSLYGIRGVALNWFKSYLNHRSQYIQLNNISSACQPLTFGVPQGSILGPLLFLLFINDMPSISQIVKYILFADDTTGLYCSSSLDDLFTTLSSEADSLNQWFAANRLTINVSKTNFVLFTTPQKYRHLQLENRNVIKFGSSEIKMRYEVKFLGLLLDNHLTFKNHIKYICTKLTKSLYAIKRASKLLPIKDLKTLYSSLFLPYLNYGLLAWGGSCKRDTKYQILNSGENKNPLRILDSIHMLQKRALRIICKSDYRAHHIPLCYKLQVLDLTDIYCIKALSFLHDCFHGNTPPSLNNLFIFKYSRDNQLTLSTTYRRTNLASTTVLHTIPNIWNPLPPAIKANILKPKKTFLSQLKTFYISKYELWTCHDHNCYVCKNR